MSSEPNIDPSSRASSPWLKSNLTALGSAAVLAVYAAGFERTRAAAARFNAEESGRRPAAPVRTTGEIHAPSPRPPDAAPRVAVNPVPATKRNVAPSKPSPASEPAPTPAPSEKRAVDSTAVVAVPVSPPPRDSTPSPVPAQVALPAKPVEVAPAPKPAPTTDTSQADKVPVRKDGTYTGWGTSRHGDIQATLQVKNGKIVFAAISECLTRYPCSWIAALPSQVLARQSADVDFVSGATESANAFYSAVVEALNKAK